MRARQILCTLMLVSSFAMSAAAQTPHHEGAHDGEWRAELETTVGKCAKRGEAVITVEDDRIARIDAADVTAWGYIDNDTNTFVGHFNSGAKVLRANGDVSGDFASGPWSSETEYCGGRWTAHKID